MNSTDKKNDAGMPVSRKGLRFVLAGVLVLIAGYVLLAGGGVKDPQVFNYAMFDARRLVAAPIVMVSGIVLIILAIMGRFEDKD
ncbi:MAG: DUF3098 domain-containing protein [Bacteroidales bacterium]|nr:DUF3098 domain-containing protein [Candidatus Cryptobacteroides aphodequi]